jgi:hypothetical protein
MPQAQETGTRGPVHAIHPDWLAGERRVTIERGLQATLEAVLRAPPEAYGYRTYDGRFGWSVPKLRQCLLERYGMDLPRSTLRRALYELHYDWKHKRWMPDREEAAS